MASTMAQSAEAKRRRLARTTIEQDFNTLSQDIIFLNRRTRNTLDINNIPEGTTRIRVTGNGQNQRQIRATKRKSRVRDGSARLRFNNRGGRSAQELFTLTTFENVDGKNTVKENLALKLLLPDNSVCTEDLSPVCGQVAFTICHEGRIQSCTGDTELTQAVTFNNECQANRYGATSFSPGQCN